MFSWLHLFAFGFGVWGTNDRVQQHAEYDTAIADPDDVFSQFRLFNDSGVYEIRPGGFSAHAFL